MNTTPINLQEKFTRFREPWSPKVIAEMNDYQFKLVRLIGEFVWHQHAGVVNTGTANSTLTAPNDVWI